MLWATMLVKNALIAPISSYAFMVSGRALQQSDSRERSRLHESKETEIGQLEVNQKPQCCKDDDVNGLGTNVLSKREEKQWWDKRNRIEKNELISLFANDWWETISETEQISFAYVADRIFKLLATPGLDSNTFDSYEGFAPLLLRTSFHSSGTFHQPSGTGGSNGGTIFHRGELEDSQNGCIDVATEEISELFRGNRVSLSDTVVIAGVVALKTMHFPHMDLVKLSGGHTDHDNGITFRDRLPGADDNPLSHFMNMYGLNMEELVALIGGGHSFGAAHAKCSGYHGQWTIDPLSWGKAENFFIDLLRDDWRWYDVCSYENDTVTLTSIDDPFANGSEPTESGSSADNDDDEDDCCLQKESLAPLICESQAIRGCHFPDGNYPTTASLCNTTELTMRLKADFFLKFGIMNAASVSFANNGTYLAEQFGLAYHKITHKGLDRCGVCGHGCQNGLDCIHGACRDEPLPLLKPDSEEVGFRSVQAQVASGGPDRRVGLLAPAVVIGFALCIVSATISFV